jgi:hypothetical protein
MGGFLMIVYFWLQPILKAKFKYLTTGGQGTLDFAPDGSIRLNVQKTNNNDCVKIRGREKSINPNFKQFKFLGIPCNLFTSAIPTNIDLQFTKKELTKEQLKLIEDLKTPLDVYEGRMDYTGIEDRDVDTHLANMTKDPLREFLLKYKNTLTYILIGIFLTLIIVAVFLYKNHEAVKLCGTAGQTLINNVVAPN